MARKWSELFRHKKGTKITEACQLFENPSGIGRKHFENPTKCPFRYVSTSRLARNAGKKKTRANQTRR